MWRLALLAGALAHAAADRTCEALPPLTTTRPKPSVDGGSNLFIGGARKPWAGRVAEVQLRASRLARFVELAITY